MRARVMLPFILALVPAMAAAQGRQGMGRRPAQRVDPQMMQRGAGAGLEGGPAQRLLEQKDQLGLTEEQVSRLEALAGEWKATHEQMREQTRQLREARQQLTQEQREQLGALREQAQAAGENARKGIQDVLTDEQRQKLGAQRGLMGGGGRAGIRRGVRPGIGGRGAFGPAGRPGPGPQFGPRGQLAPGPQGWAPRWQAPFAPRMQNRPFVRGGVFAPRQPMGPRAQMQRRVPVPVPPPAPLQRRRFMDPDTAF